jgi:MoaA/NifB/PqqE/SkfB family radical SAM enzyme
MQISDVKLATGSSYLRKASSNNFDREKFMIQNLEYNKAFTEKAKNLSNKEYDKLLNELKDEYRNYRTSWIGNADMAFSSGKFDKFNPLCLDIETASICDLACPHCWREYILTPDKIMDFDFYKRIIDTAIKLHVPSIKLNWRGEPLLNPKLEEFISYAKKKGILEVLINTNATTLTEKRADSLIESGLDQLIYSFDGGTKTTYEKMRPARFKKNKFEDVYKNIRNFNKIKIEKKSLFPITKIQMVLTKETRDEIEDYFNLFSDCVDDVSVQPYTERGGNLEGVESDYEIIIAKYIEENNLPKNTNYYVGVNGDIYISVGRKPCRQLFQRLMITFDGRVAMCCQDWGAQHCLGFIDKDSFNIEKTLQDLEKKIQQNKKGFELLKNAKRPTKFNEPEKKISTLEEIWTGDELDKVRKLHMTKKLDEVGICKNCDVKDTYEWKRIK